MDRDIIMSLGVSDLRNKLEELGLDSRGKKNELREKLLSHFDLDSVDAGENNDSISLTEDEPRVVTPREIATREIFYTLKDVEDSLVSFDGLGSPDISKWLLEFEETATIVRWTPLQMFVYGKQLLKGAARLYIRSQEGINNWKTLKEALEEEFGTVVSAAEVHRTLCNRRLKKDESLLEYLYAIMEVGKHIKLDDSSIIEYFVNGIDDSK